MRLNLFWWVASVLYWPKQVVANPFVTHDQLEKRNASTQTNYLGSGSGQWTVGSEQWAVSSEHLPGYDSPLISSKILLLIIVTHGQSYTSCAYYPWNISNPITTQSHRSHLNPPDRKELQTKWPCRTYTTYRIMGRGRERLTEWMFCAYVESTNNLH